MHLQHDMVVSAELSGKGVLGIRESDRCFSAPKLFFAYGLGNAGYFPLAVGATSILWPGRPAAADVYAVIERHRPTLLFFVPTGYGMMLACEGDFDLSSIRLASSAGEALPPSLYTRFKERFGIDIIDGIGSTEATHTFISNRPGAIRPGSSGLLVDGYDAALLDEDRRPVPDGEVGSLFIRGDSICDGYWNQTEKTRETFQDGWMRTGDRLLAGRRRLLLARRPRRRHAESRRTLGQPDRSRERPARTRGGAGVRGRRPRGRRRARETARLRRAARRHGGSPELAAALRDFVRTRLADYKRPRWVEFLDELPRTATGKIQRFKLRADA